MRNSGNRYQNTKLKGIAVLVTLSAVLASPSVGFSQTQEAVRSSVEEFEFPKFQRVKYYPSALMIPEADYDLMEKGIEQRARAQALLLEALYSSEVSEAEREKIFRLIPILRPRQSSGEPLRFMDLNAGFASELMGQLHPSQLGRFYAPDIVLGRPPQEFSGGSESAKRYRPFILEENGGNPAALIRLEQLTEYFMNHPENGPVPNNDGMIKRFADHIKELAARLKPGVQKPVIVIAQEYSLQKEWIDAKGETRKTPAPRSAEEIENVREIFAREGMIWLSLVDQTDKDRLVVRQDGLYLKTPQPGGRVAEVRVDVFVPQTDIESLDPEYKPQVERNAKAFREDMTELGEKVVGIRGVFDLWRSLQNHSDPSKRLLIVNGLPAMLSASKIWPMIVDMYIRRVMKEKVVLPFLETKIFVNEQTGSFDEKEFDRLWESLDERGRNERTKWVVKKTRGEGGLQNLFPHTFESEAQAEEAKRQVKADLKINPYSWVFQKRVELTEISLDFEGRIKPMRFFNDFRLFTLLSPLKVTKMKQLMIRLSQSASVNITLGGVLALAGKAISDRVKPFHEARSGEGFKEPQMGTARGPLNRCVKAINNLGAN